MESINRISKIFSLFGVAETLKMSIPKVTDKGYQHPWRVLKSVYIMQLLTVEISMLIIPFSERMIVHPGTGYSFSVKDYHFV
jgi:hypothetical protein